VTDEPYRPRPAESSELARLAVEGQQRIREAQGRASSQLDARPSRRDWNVRVALGGYYGAPVWTASYVLGTTGLVALVVALVTSPTAAAVLFLVPAAALLIRLFAPPAANRARVAAERAWATSLPFALDGYFETLADPPAFRASLVIDVTWSGDGRGPGRDVLRQILGVVDTGASVEVCEGSTARARSGWIWCGTRVRLNRAAITRNTRIVAYVHDLVDRVLVPLHRDCPIARVSFARA
jgi:hypothetical protein